MLTEYIRHGTITKYEFSVHHTKNTPLNFKNHCIGYLLKGEGEFLYKSKKYYAKEGDLIYIAAGTRYYSFWYGHPEIEFYSIDFAFNVNSAYNEYPFQIVKNFSVDYFHQMFQAQNSLEFMAVLYSMLYNLYPKMKKEHFLKNSTISPAIEYIESHFKENISIRELAQLCKLSESHFFALFKKQTTLTPIQYKHNLLVQNAIDMLTLTDKTIEEISEELNFSSSNYFRKIFISVTGHTPKEYRK